MAKPRWLTPEQLVTWRRIVYVNALLPAALERQLRADSDMSLFEYHVLAMLSDQPDRTARMSQLAALAGGSPSRLSHTIARMEREGLVERLPGSGDGRAVLARMTDAGWQRIVGAAPAHATYVHTHIVEAFDDEQWQSLGELLGTLQAVLEQGERP